MTARKYLRSAGRRPSLSECIEAWWRVADSPAGKIFPQETRGTPVDKASLCNEFDLYCWQLVGKALVACRTRQIPATRLAELVAHIQCGGRFSTFRVYEVIQHDPSDDEHWRSRPRPVNEVDRIGIDEPWIARAAYAKFRSVLQRVIDNAEPYAAASRGDG